MNSLVRKLCPHESTTAEGKPHDVDQESLLTDDQHNFSVRSQTNPESRYTVSNTGNGLIGQCRDHITRKEDTITSKSYWKLSKTTMQKRQHVTIMKHSKLELCKLRFRQDYQEGNQKKQI